MIHHHLEHDRSALLIIDMQYDFANPAGRAYIAGSREILPELIELARIFRENRRPVFHIVRLYHPDGSNAELCRKGVVSSDNPVVAPGSPGAAIVPGLLPDGAGDINSEALLSGRVVQLGERDFILYKPRWGAFYQTALHDVLQSNGINSLLVAGCNFPNCPRTTIYEASERDYRLAILPSAMSGVYDRGIHELRNIGVLLFTELSAVDFFLKTDIVVMNYQPAFREAFKQLNIAWLNQYFTVEPIDEYVLSNPEEAILKDGGRLLFAIQRGVVIGTVALKNMGNGRFELTKMTVRQDYRGKGIGTVLCRQAITEAERIGATELVLFSHRRLPDALWIYRKLGFVDTEVDRTTYARADVMMRRLLGG